MMENYNLAFYAYAHYVMAKTYCNKHIYRVPSKTIHGLGYGQVSIIMNIIYHKINQEL